MFKVTTNAKNLTDSFRVQMEQNEFSSIAKAGAGAAGMAMYINMRLEQLFGAGRHFSVDVTYMSQGIFKINIHADEIGHYIYYGTSSHNITSPLAMPLGDNRFASRVNHPGTESRKKDIDAIIFETMMALKAGNTPWHS